VREQKKVVSKDEIFFINLLHLSSGCSPHPTGQRRLIQHLTSGILGSLLKMLATNWKLDSKGPKLKMFGLEKFQAKTILQAGLQ
jgi:hypothetical protein